MKNEVAVVVRILSDNEKHRIRPLYEEVFDDSKYFLDYYFGSYIKGTINFVCEEDGHIIGMATIHPKVIIVSNRAHKAGYVYAVATKPSHRGKGVMRGILDTIYAYARNNSYDYLYLIPVDPKIYEGQGYKLLRGKSEIKVKSKKVNGLRVEKITWDKIDKYIEFAEKHYQNSVSIECDKDYFLQNLNVLSIKNSGIYCILDEICDKILGLAFVWEEEELNLANLICDDGDRKVCMEAIADKLGIEEITYKIHDIMFKEVHGSMDELNCHSICINDEI